MVESLTAFSKASGVGYEVLIIFPAYAGGRAIYRQRRFWFLKLKSGVSRGTWVFLHPIIVDTIKGFSSVSFCSQK